MRALLPLSCRLSPEGAAQDTESSSVSDGVFEEAVEYLDEHPLPSSETDRKETDCSPGKVQAEQSTPEISKDLDVRAAISGHESLDERIQGVQSGLQDMNLDVPSSSSKEFSPHSPSGSPPSGSAPFSPRTPSLSPQPSTPPLSSSVPSTPSSGGTGDVMRFETLPGDHKMTAVNVSHVDSPSKFTVSSLGGSVYFYQSDY